jgi:hypothetical protein
MAPRLAKTKPMLPFSGMKYAGLEVDTKYSGVMTMPTTRRR